VTSREGKVVVSMGKIAIPGALNGIKCIQEVEILGFKTIIYVLIGPGIIFIIF
jgi:hypothetical protein